MEELEESQHEHIVFSNQQIDIPSLPKLAVLEYSLLEKNLLKANIVWAVLFFGIAIIVEVFLQYYIGLEWLLQYGHFVLMGLISLLVLISLFIYFAFFKKSYAIREKDIVYNNGLFWQSSIVIPFNRVQHCEVSIGPIDRIYGLAELKVFTAGGSSSDLKIEGLTPDSANRIKDYIVKKTGIDEEE